MRKYKYGSQVIFNRIDMTAQAMRSLQVLWDDHTSLCRYRYDDTNYCDRDKCACHWDHCTVDGNTVDSDFSAVSTDPSHI